MQELVTTLLSYKILLSHALLVFLIAVVMARKSWGRTVFSLVGKYAIHLGFLVVLGAIVGSLFYSEVIGFEACVLCWWQRVFLYPLAPILAIALWKKDEGVWKYVVPLTVAAAIIGAYQVVANFTGISVLSCTAEGAACSKIYVREFGYITIPVMALTVSVYILLLAWMKKLYRNEFR